MRHGYDTTTPRGGRHLALDADNGPSMDKIGLHRVTHYTLASGVNGKIEELDYRTRPHAALLGWWIGEIVFSNHET